ncbi:ATP synthase F1 subunit gamma [Coraliomargarita sp. SDUM461003]|uniref:ATP synthase gamma chain n=1 Tax=Thalassobacterium maritimum TaxID=3041265 RepID=A0ABU1AXF6_9BACT|nr:ATP synthase F1 subunit gamma [Coraliomargarita sp. SDUM461003]MBT65166.1 ATP synthase F1 subunit gamma [Puniceicoccaceae bacterium]MDQ8208788.1 ATP synthase F1 subunit gamma [Coraliomargarita sp. SDUM461003]HBR92577.1 ATP synthase F1 subunit gamma [Opitutae bacterium]|tara:strand:+ start:13046 stop:13945 length:900 start_codon:yes stop_codon:yes gene_type:complete
MANLRDIRRRIKSVKNTRQITRAMQLVSSSKMKRAQDAAVAGRPYALLLADLLDTVGEKLDLSGATISHPFFEKREVKTRGILILSTDKGLCGPLNTNLFRKISDEVKGDAKFVAVGRKATQFVTRSGRDLVADFTVSDKANFQELRPMLKLLIDAYKAGEIDTIEVAYPSFVNVLVQEPVIQSLLPIVDLSEVLEQLKKRVAGEEEILAARKDSREMVFEPSAEEVLEQLPDLYVKVIIHQLLLESRAAEYSARMVAMKAATDNASSLVDDLTLDYNKARQAAITQEILEIAAAASAN